MTTYTAITTLDNKDRAAALGEAIERLKPAPIGVGVFDIEDGSGMREVGGYFTDAPDRVALALLAAAFGARPFVVSQVPDVDWVAHVKRQLSPVSAGRFFVYGSHDADQVPPGSVGLLIEAAMAFGTGHHGTTLGCLLALEALIEAGLEAKNVLDLGCGTAVLGMAAATVFEGHVIASDIDPVAIDVAKANVAANRLEGRVDCIVAIGMDDARLARATPYDLIFANILKGPLLELAPDIARASALGGFVVLSGILNEQANEILAAYRRERFDLVRSRAIGDWSTLTLKKTGN